jgi:hypothetical protein
MESKNVLNPPSFFVSMATAAKFIQPIPIFLVYLAPLDVDVVSYQVSSISVWQVTCNDNFCFFRIFRILAISMAMAAILNLFNPQKLPHTTVDILAKFHEV